MLAKGQVRLWPTTLQGPWTLDPRREALEEPSSRPPNQRFPTPETPKGFVGELGAPEFEPGIVG